MEDGGAPNDDTQASELQPEGASDQEEDPKEAHLLTPDFPESLFELLCTLQEGRRLNDQRCSFRLEGGMRRRRCHSEPNTNKPAHRVVFSSMTSLQKEEFFELVATAQARRLDDQRARLGRSPPPKPRARSLRGSLRQLSLARRTPAPVAPPAPKEDLYDMILTTQAQGRLEDQRSRAPGPMDDEDFFSLLLRVQGGRMEEQRTALPCLLQT
ncbi:G-protein-signaling modulator 3 [Menidia menidia]